MRAFLRYKCLEIISLLWPSSFLSAFFFFSFLFPPRLVFLLILRLPRASATLVSSSKWIRNNQVFWLGARSGRCCSGHRRPSRRCTDRAFGACLAGAPICRVYKSATFCLVSFSDDIYPPRFLAPFFFFLSS